MRAVTSFPALQPQGLHKLENCLAQSNHAGYGMRANKTANKLKATEAGQPQAGARLRTFFAELAAESPPLRGLTGAFYYAPVMIWLGLSAADSAGAGPLNRGS